MQSEQERYETEKREFVRVNVDVPVRYKFLSKSIRVPDEIFEGRTGNLSGGGLLLMGRVPHEDLYAHLLTQRVLIGVLVQLPTRQDPIKALCRVAWIEAHQEPGRVAVGLAFREITRDHQDAVFQYVIKRHLP
jgi:c-di-GMP-binding flagellar brake protein YcgR